MPPTYCVKGASRTGHGEENPPTSTDPLSLTGETWMTARTESKSEGDLPQDSGVKKPPHRAAIRKSHKHHARRTGRNPHQSALKPKLFKTSEKEKLKICHRENENKTLYTENKKENRLLVRKE